LDKALYDDYPAWWLRTSSKFSGKNKRNKGPFIKDIRSNREKLTSLSFCPYGHTINFKKFKVFTPKSADVYASEELLLSLTAKCLHGKKTLLSDCGRLL